MSKGYESRTEGSKDRNDHYDDDNDDDDDNYCDHESGKALSDM